MHIHAGEVKTPQRLFSSREGRLEGFARKAQDGPGGYAPAGLGGCCGDRASGRGLGDSVDPVQASLQHRPMLLGQFAAVLPLELQAFGS